MDLEAIDPGEAEARCVDWGTGVAHEENHTKRYDFQHMGEVSHGYFGAEGSFDQPPCL